jgi:hypothetical protein
MKMKPVTVIAEDRVALLADISYVLGKSGVNIESLNMEIVGGKAVISFLVRDPRKARDVLERNGYNTAELDAIVIKVSNHISEMAKITEKLSKARVSIDDMSIISSSPNEGVFALKVDKPRKAVKLLGDNVLINSNSSYG